jgi:dynein heavy chain
VPTTESQQNQGLLRILVLHDFPLLFLGRTGTGKTLAAKRFLLDDVDSSAYLPTITAFSANTSCTQVLEVLEQRLEKQKRRKGVYGPLIGTINLIFIDDLNMPRKE